MAIKNRYEIMYWLECKNANPNGDPDAGNLPRIDPEDMHGLISDVAVKRRIRNYVQYACGNQKPNAIIMQQSTNINRFIAEAHIETQTGASATKKASKDQAENAKEWICENFFDVRTFGAVLSTGANAGQVRGAAQMTFLRSIESIVQMDISITRMLVAEDADKAKTVEEFLKWEQNRPEDKLRTMGRKQLIPYGLYEGKAFISANLAEQTGFSDEDLQLFLDALVNLYEHDRSSSKGEMNVVLPAFIFRHTGTDSNEEQRTRQAKLGCAPAHKLFDLIQVSKKAEVAAARKFSDYEWTVDVSRLPKGVDIGYIVEEGGQAKVLWNEMPTFDWLTEKNTHA